MKTLNDYKKQPWFLKVLFTLIAFGASGLLLSLTKKSGTALEMGIGLTLGIPLLFGGIAMLADLFDVKAKDFDTNDDRY